MNVVFGRMGTAVHPDRNRSAVASTRAERQAGIVAEPGPRTSRHAVRLIDGRPLPREIGLGRYRNSHQRRHQNDCGTHDPHALGAAHACTPFNIITMWQNMAWDPISLHSALS